ncbi:ATP-dependent RNA helicase SUPV3L1, mitochondrial-like protein [Martensiomyces pterosporus]|nr:ATP-dependent RNA helicase SUPV3L1, mitochondrial-like protein [Martensiomyces pterosporus]
MKRCAYFGIREGVFKEWSERFVEKASSDSIDRLLPAKLVPLLVRDGSEAFDDFIVNQFFAFLGKEAPHVVENISYLREITDLRYPHEWAKGARKIQRRIVMHVGPTNSGKTYHALQRLQQAKSGIYCSPLRLLAYEVYNRMTGAGISCSLLTGEDRRGPDYENTGVKPAGYAITGEPVSSVLACTIEMAPNVHYNVAVIDEIQMISDRQRGWAWTSALLNLRANEVHLCGEPSAVPLVKKICARLDEEVEVREYTRLGQLDVGRKSLEGNWKNIRKGDCVVTFSRKSIFSIKNTIESKTGLRCAVIYGSLPPEARVEQARLFNDPDSGYDVLVASDAVGMGINLSINRVVFVSMTKWDGEAMKPISVSQTRQIGGRAGRFNSGADGGTVTTMETRDLKLLHSTMNRMPPSLAAAGLKPETEVIEMFSHQFPKVPFSQLWTMFRDIATVGNDFFLCSFRDQEAIAQAIEELPLTIRDRYQFLYAPINCRDPIALSCVRQYAAAVANRQECKVADVIKLPKKEPKTRDDLRVLEQWHRSITLYLWLTFHFPETFTQSEEATEMKVHCEKVIQEGLERIHASTKRPGKQAKKNLGDADTGESQRRHIEGIRKALGIM